jgi:hypothetical protein
MFRIELPYTTQKKWIERHEWRNDGRIYALYCASGNYKQLLATFQGLNNALVLYRDISNYKSDDTELQIYRLSREDYLRSIGSLYFTGRGEGANVPK